MRAVTTGSSSHDRWVDGLVYGLIALQGLVFWLLCQRIEDFAPDSATYQGLAHNLLHDGRYVFNFAPHIQYPPALPVLLAAIAAVFGEAHRTLLQAMSVIAAIGLLVAYQWQKDEQGRAAAAVGAVLLGVSVLLCIYSTAVVNSDVPYLVVSMGALVLGARLDVVQSRGRTALLAVGFTACLVMAALLRSAGVALLGAYGLWLAILCVRQRRLLPRQIVVFGIPLVVAGLAEAGWWLHVQRAKAEALAAWGGAYEEQFRLLDPHDPSKGFATIGDIVARIPDNVVQHTGHLLEIASGLWVGQTWYSPLIVVPLLLIVCGFVATVVRRPGPATLYFFLYALLYAMWPFDVGGRFMLPVFAIAFVYGWRGALLLWDAAARDPRRAGFVAIAAGLALLVASLATQRVAPAPSMQARLAPLFWLVTAVAGGLLAVARARRHAITQAATGLVCRRVRIASWSASIAQCAGCLLVAVLAVRGIEAQRHFATVMGDAGAAGIYHAPSVDAARWIDAHTQPTDVVMAEQLAVVHYVSGRRIVGFPATRDGDAIMQAIVGQDARFLVVIDSSRRSTASPRETVRLAALKEVHGDRLQQVATGEGFQIYRIVPPPATSPTSKNASTP